MLELIYKELTGDAGLPTNYQALAMAELDSQITLLKGLVEKLSYSETEIEGIEYYKVARTAVSDLQAQHYDTDETGTYCFVLKSSIQQNDIMPVLNKLFLENKHLNDQVGALSTWQNTKSQEEFENTYKQYINVLSKLQKRGIKNNNGQSMAEFVQGSSVYDVERVIFFTAVRYANRQEVLVQHTQETGAEVTIANSTSNSPVPSERSSTTAMSVADQIDMLISSIEEMIKSGRAPLQDPSDSNSAAAYNRNMALLLSWKEKASLQEQIDGLPEANEALKAVKEKLAAPVAPIIPTFAVKRVDGRIVATTVNSSQATPAPVVEAVIPEITNTTVSRLPLKRNPFVVAAATIVVIGALGVAGIGVAIAFGYVASFAFLAALSLPAILVVAGVGAGVSAIAGLAVSAYNNRQEYNELKVQHAIASAKAQEQDHVGEYSLEEDKTAETRMDVTVAASAVAQKQKAPVAKTQIFSKPKFMSATVVPMVELPAKQPVQKPVARNEFDLKGYGL